MESSTATIVGAIGMIALAASWFARKQGANRIAQFGWIGVGLFFFNMSWTYFDYGDIVLTTMCAITLPLCIGVAIWEDHCTDSQREALDWARGTVAFAGGPYLLIAYVPYLSVLAIWFVATQSAWFLGFAGGQKIEVGTTWVNAEGGRVSWSQWEGNRWFSTDFTGEYAFQSELILADGSLIGINFVLACTALQSMVLFIGAISVLNLHWKQRVRALFLIVPLIHLLNVFRNAGLIWMHMTYEQWDLWGISVFEFGHTYIARFVSLFAMFLMALIMFEILPGMHRNIVALCEPFTQKKSKH